MYIYNVYIILQNTTTFDRAKCRTSANKSDVVTFFNNWNVQQRPTGASQCPHTAPMQIAEQASIIYSFTHVAVIINTQLFFRVVTGLDIQYAFRTSCYLYHYIYKTAYAEPSDEVWSAQHLEYLRVYLLYRKY